MLLSTPMRRRLKRQAPSTFTSDPQISTSAPDGGFYVPDPVALSVTDTGFLGAMATATGFDVTDGQAEVSYSETVILVAPSGTNAGQVIITSVPVSQTGAFSSSDPTVTDSFSFSLPTISFPSQGTPSTTTWSSISSTSVTSSITSSSTTSSTKSSTSSTKSSTKSTTSAPSTTSTSTAHALSQTSPTPSPTDTPHHLSKGATAAIAVIIPLAVLAAAISFLAWYCTRRYRQRYHSSPKVYPEEAWLYDPPMPRRGGNATRGSSEAGVPLITLSSDGGHEYAAHPLPSAAGGSAPGSSGGGSAMSGAARTGGVATMSGAAMGAHAVTPDQGGPPAVAGAAGAGGAGAMFGDRLVDYAGERDGLLAGAAGGGGGPYARGGRAYAAEPMLPPIPQPPAPTVAVALPFVANARGAYARAPTDEAEMEAVDPYRDVHPAMREDDTGAAELADPFRDVHPALREDTTYDPGRTAMSAADKEIAPGGPG